MNLRHLASLLLLPALSASLPAQQTSPRKPALARPAAAQTDAQTAATPTAVTTTGGTAGLVPAFTGASTIGNSIIYATPTGVGIGRSPSAFGILDIGGTAIFRGALELARTGDATAAMGTGSNPFRFNFQHYNSAKRFVYNPFFQFQAEAINNNTAFPSGTMNLLYYNGIGGTPTETGLYFTSFGTIHFSDSQTFPIAAGPQGPQGPPGATGPQGPAGPAALTLPYSASVDAKGQPLLTLVNTGTSGGRGINVLAGDGIGKSGGYGIFATGGAAANASGQGGGTGGIFQGGSAVSGSVGGNGIEVYAGKGEGANTNGTAIYAVSPSNGGIAGIFDGPVTVYGTITKPSGSFKIDHPLDPANKYLSHSFVESPDMKNIYDGNVTTDGRGEAIVTLPEWFEALNRDFRYQLTTIGSFSRAMVASEISNRKFIIRTEEGNVKVSWQVTGIRQDAWANAHRVPLEEDKSDIEKGHYTHPELFGHKGEPSIPEINHSSTRRNAPLPQD